jgi:hypothetical protein
MLTPRKAPFLYFAPMFQGGCSRESGGQGGGIGPH